MYEEPVSDGQRRHWVAYVTTSVTRVNLAWLDTHLCIRTFDGMFENCDT